jgi:hypothetical protein
MWQALNNFWNPTPELRAANELPGLRAQLKVEWKNWWRWPVIWRRFVVMIVALQLFNVGYLAVRGFETVASERQKQALLSPNFLTDESMEKLDRAMQAQARADRALASYYCSRSVDPRNAGLKLECGPWNEYWWSPAFGGIPLKGKAPMTRPSVGENVRVRYAETFNYIFDVNVATVCPNNEFEGLVEEIFDQYYHGPITGGAILKLKGQKKRFQNTDIVWRLHDDP